MRLDSSQLKLYHLSAQVCVSRLGLPVLATASADQTARVWGMHSGACLLQYHGHSGSVNSVRFHPTKELVLTCSGDGTAHIWQCAVNLHNESSSGRVAVGSSEDELEWMEDGAGEDLPEPGEVEPSLTGASDNNSLSLVSPVLHFSDNMKSMPNDKPLLGSIMDCLMLTFLWLYSD